MKPNASAEVRSWRVIAASAALLLALGLQSFATRSDQETPSTESAEQQDKITVVPYKTRQAPSHRVSLHDGRVFFLKRLEEIEGGFILHTMEDETIEVQRDEVAEVVEFKVE